MMENKKDKKTPEPTIERPTWFKDVELLLELMQRPQYVYRMAKGLIGGSSTASKGAVYRRDKALLEIARMISAYNNGTLWHLAEKEKVKLYSKIQNEEAKSKRREGRDKRRI